MSNESFNSILNKNTVDKNEYKQKMKKYEQNEREKSISFFVDRFVTGIKEAIVGCAQHGEYTVFGNKKLVRGAFPFGDNILFQYNVYGNVNRKINGYDISKDIEGKHYFISPKSTSKFYNCKLSETDDRSFLMKTGYKKYYHEYEISEFGKQVFQRVSQELLKDNIIISHYYDVMLENHSCGESPYFKRKYTGFKFEVSYSSSFKRPVSDVSLCVNPRLEFEIEY